MHLIGIPQVMSNSHGGLEIVSSTARASALDVVRSAEMDIPDMVSTSNEIPGMVYTGNFSHHLLSCRTDTSRLLVL